VAGAPGDRLAQGSGFGALLQSARGGEFRRLARGDLDRLSGRWIAPLPGRTVADAELAEAGKRDLPAGGQLVGDSIDRALEHLAGLVGGQSVSPRDLFG